MNFLHHYSTKTDKEYQKAKRRRSYLKNRNIEIARAREWALAHPEKAAESKRQTHKRYKEKYSEQAKMKKRLTRKVLSQRVLKGMRIKYEYKFMATRNSQGVASGCGEVVSVNHRRSLPYEIDKGYGDNVLVKKSEIMRITKHV